MERYTNSTQYNTELVKPMNTQLVYVLLSFFIGGLAGWMSGNYFLRKWIARQKRILQIRKRGNQFKLLEHFRIEVKNNTIRLKKELRRLGVSRQLAPIELLFKNYQNRLYKIDDKELLYSLQNFYGALYSLQAIIDALSTVIEKKLVQIENLQDQVLAQLYNSITTMVVQHIEKIVETGLILGDVIEEKIDERRAPSK